MVILLVGVENGNIVGWSQEWQYRWLVSRMVISLVGIGNGSIENGSVAGIQE